MPGAKVFANYSVTTWGYYPSWVIGSVHGLDYTQPMPVTATRRTGFRMCRCVSVCPIGSGRLWGLEWQP